MVSSGLIRDLGLRPRGAGLGGDSSAHSGQRLDVYELNGLMVGNGRFDHITVVADPSGRDAGPLTELDGILSLDTFRDRVITVDFAHKRLRLAGTRLDARTLARSTPYRSDNGCPVVPARIGNVRLDVRLDSGSEMGLLLPNSYRKQVHLASNPVSAGSFRTMFNTFSIEQAQVSDGIAVCGQTVRLDRVSFSDAFPAANFGSRAMAGLSLTFSPTEHRIVIDPNP